jgi:hypothetical protein
MSHATLQNIEGLTAVWYDKLSTVLRLVYNTNGQKEPVGWQRFDVMMPAVPEACPSLQRVGGDEDGGKLICGLNHIPNSDQNPCIVYSIGGNNVWSFEEDIVRTTHCNVFTFDCTVNGEVPAAIEDRVTFIPFCVGSSSQNADPNFKSLKDLMLMLNHSHITLLKADIEGYEYDLFNHLLSEDDLELPEQISFEMHYSSIMGGLDWREREITSGELALFSRNLYDAGYRVISREDNRNCGHCSEFTVVRVRCPPGPRTMEERVQH